MIRKSILLLILVALFCFLTLGTYAQIQSDRDSLYRNFGPQILEAQMDVMLDEINAVRAKVGLEPRTKQQLADALAAKLEATADYTWQNEGGKR